MFLNSYLRPLFTVAWLSVLLTATNADAATVRFDPTAQIVSLGGTTPINVDIVGADFLDGTDSGGLNVTFNPAILRATQVTLSPLWNFFTATGSIDNSAGTVTGIQFATLEATPPSEFLIATIDFTPIGLGTSHLEAIENLDLSGFIRGTDKLSVDFATVAGGTNGLIEVVPLPTAGWLFLSALVGLARSLSARRASALHTPVM